MSAASSSESRSGNPSDRLTPTTGRTSTPMFRRGQPSAATTSHITRSPSTSPASRNDSRISGLRAAGTRETRSMCVARVNIRYGASSAAASCPITRRTTWSGRRSAVEVQHARREALDGRADPLHEQLTDAGRLGDDAPDLPQSLSGREPAALPLRQVCQRFDDSGRDRHPPFFDRRQQRPGRADLEGSVLRAQHGVHQRPRIRRPRRRLLEPLEQRDDDGTGRVWPGGEAAARATRAGRRSGCGVTARSRVSHAAATRSGCGR